MKHAQNIMATLIIMIGAISPCHAAKEKAGKPSLFNYDYAQASYVDIDGGYDGLAIGGSHDIQKNLAVTASYMMTDDSRGTDYNLFGVGATYHSKFDQLDDSDLALHGEFLKASIGNNLDDTGFRLGAMIRHLSQKNLEIFGDISLSTLFDDDLTLTPGIVLNINKQTAAVVSYELGDADMLSLGIRIKLE